MTANLDLVKQRNVSVDSVALINELHDLLYKLLDSYTLDVPYEEAESLVKSANKTLSDLWGFEYNPRYDQWTPRLAQKWMNLTWENRTFVCKDTGFSRTIKENDIYEGNFIIIGNCATDLGRVNSYHRMVGNIEEIK